MKRSQKITVRVTPEELEIIKRGAARRWPDLVGRMPLAQLVRSLLLLAAKPVSVTKTERCDQYHVPL